MDETKKGGKVLVVGSIPDFHQLVGKSLENRFDVIYASNENEGLSKARTERPQVLILGYLDPRGSSFRLHKKLREGWITKHIPQLVVDVHFSGEPEKAWTPQEAMQMDLEDYLLIAPGDVISLTESIEALNLTEKIDAKLGEKANALREAILDPKTFCVTWEQIPGRGAFEMQQEQVFDNVARAAELGKIHALSVTDNPGGNPAISTEMLCAEIKRVGAEPLVHLACRDKNRSEIESMLYGLAAQGVRNVLLLSGDYPSGEGFEGRPKPVFDIDPVNMVRLIETMNRGLEHHVMGKKVILAPTDFFAGVCVSPFKKLESELVAQYAKLKKKIEAGGKFIITQVGYDARKLHEVLQWLRVNGYLIPALANIYILPYGAAKLMNANGIPGCVVTGKLVAELAEEAKAQDKGKSTRLLRAAKLYALSKGMGYAGAHIGGHGITSDMVEFIITKGEELSKSWQSLVAEFDYPQKDGFYLFEKDPKTGLNTEVYAKKPLNPSKPLIYRFSRVAHHMFFNEKRWWFKSLQPFARWVDASPKAKKVFEFFEHLAKAALFHCLNCGDCALFDVAYVCPMSQCPKNQRNGACGGSYEGWCEVYPNEKKCLWVQVYQRYKAYHEEAKISAYSVPPCNWDLWQTSSWLNFYLGRDHTAKRLGIKPPSPEPPPKETTGDSKKPRVPSQSKA
ncbi:MAG: methylenetetrahydrofolate reductase C-terminal domain-containing protein [Desulfobacterales bacterium]|nr:methylenetetrahydrofolate reductase C-terminal domain-containing protein [Desulfobacterales bacterium]